METTSSVTTSMVKVDESVVLKEPEAVEAATEDEITMNCDKVPASKRSLDEEWVVVRPVTTSALQQQWRRASEKGEPCHPAPRRRTDARRPKKT